MLAAQEQHVEQVRQQLAAAYHYQQQQQELREALASAGGEGGRGISGAEWRREMAAAQQAEEEPDPDAEFVLGGCYAAALGLVLPPLRQPQLLLSVPCCRRGLPACLGLISQLPATPFCMNE